MDKTTIKLHESWLAHIGGEFDQPYMAELKAFLLAEKRNGKTIFPAGNDIFNALNSTPFDDVRVVILGQDPYHGPGQAHGLCFSVREGLQIPPSLQNIFKELNQSLGLSYPSHGCLQAWANQGVLLLNATLTVEQGRAGSHQGRGWETFTDAVIAAVDREKRDVVFLLWGSYAHKKGAFINSERHLVLRSPHPSPLSAHRGFFGNQHFARTNEFLVSKGQQPIAWDLS